MEPENPTSSRSRWSNCLREMKLGQILSVTVFEAAMGPMIGASIVAMDHELDPPLVTMMVGIGIPLSFLTVPAWWRLLSFF
jgi:malate permease and related proteins